MIVSCPNCPSKFQVDDSKISPNGTKVRCSKCSHVFKAFRQEHTQVGDAEQSEASPSYENFFEEKHDTDEVDVADPFANQLGAAAEPEPQSQASNDGPASDLSDILGSNSLNDQLFGDVDYNEIADDGANADFALDQDGNRTDDVPIPSKEFTSDGVVEVPPSLQEQMVGLESENIPHTEVQAPVSEEISQLKEVSSVEPLEVPKKVSKKDSTVHRQIAPATSRRFVSDGEKGPMGKLVPLGLVIMLTVFVMSFGFDRRGLDITKTGDWNLLLRYGFFAEGGALQLLEHRGYVVERLQGKPLFVVQGKVVNRGRQEVSASRIKVTLSDRAGKTILTGRQSCCSEVPVERYQKLGRTSSLDSVGAKTRVRRLKPGKITAFTTALELSELPSSYSVDLVNE